MRRGVCSVCGAEGYVQAHHPDYSEPTRTVNLCPDCHEGVHGGRLRPDLKPPVTRNELRLREAARTRIESGIERKDASDGSRLLVEVDAENEMVAMLVIPPGAPSAWWPPLPLESNRLAQRVQFA